MHKMSVPKALLLTGGIALVTGVAVSMLKQSLNIDPSTTLGTMAGPAVFGAVSASLLIWVQRCVRAGRFAWLRKKSE